MSKLTELKLRERAPQLLTGSTGVIATSASTIVHPALPTVDNAKLNKIWIHQVDWVSIAGSSTNFDAEIYDTSGASYTVPSTSLVYQNTTINQIELDKFASPLDYQDRDSSGRVHLKFDNNAGNKSKFYYKIHYTIAEDKAIV